MKKLNQLGFTHVAIFAALIVIAGVAFAGYRVLGSSSANVMDGGGGLKKAGACNISAPNTAKVGQSFTVTRTIKNVGAASFTPVVAESSIANGHDYSAVPPTLKKGQSSKQSGSIKSPKAGKFNLTMTSKDPAFSCSHLITIVK